MLPLELGVDAPVLAGVLYGQRKLYVGRSVRRSGSVRWVPSWSVELPGVDPSEHWWVLPEIFGVPYARSSFGKPLWRYSLTDRAQIADLARALADFWPTGRGFPTALAAFCDDPSDELLAVVDAAR